MMQRAGTAFYMAPEMINAGVYDQKAASLLARLFLGFGGCFPFKPQKTRHFWQGIRRRAAQFDMFGTC